VNTSAAALAGSLGEVPNISGFSAKVSSQCPCWALRTSFISTPFFGRILLCSFISIYFSEKAFSEIPPGLPFPKGGEFFPRLSIKNSLFPLWDERGF
jgi:hypothetical protein